MGRLSMAGRHVNDAGMLQCSGALGFGDDACHACFRVRIGRLIWVVLHRQLQRSLCWPPWLMVYVVCCFEM